MITVAKILVAISGFTLGVASPAAFADVADNTQISEPIVVVTEAVGVIGE